MMRAGDGASRRGRSVVARVLAHTGQNGSAELARGWDGRRGRCGLGRPRIWATIGPQSCQYGPLWATTGERNAEFGRKTEVVAQKRQNRGHAENKAAAMSVGSGQRAVEVVMGERGLRAQYRVPRTQYRVPRTQPRRGIVGPGPINRPAAQAAFCGSEQPDRWGRGIVGRAGKVQQVQQFARAVRENAGCCYLLDPTPRNSQSVQKIGAAGRWATGRPARPRACEGSNRSDFGF